MPYVKIWTDGATRGNPGPGGWGAVLQYRGTNKTTELEIFGHVGEETTNQRMEILAVIKALEELKQGCLVKIFSDSKYVCNGLTHWIHGWLKRGWKNKQGKPVANQDLWTRLLDLSKKHKVEMVWVKGHDGDLMNERADELAQKGKTTEVNISRRRIN